VGKFLGDVWSHVVAPRVWTLGDFTPSAESVENPLLN
jgi:hypothetical protein